MKPNSIVIVSLQTPNERFFGRLLEIAMAGVTVRGIDLGAFEDWMNNIAEREENGLQPTTIFFPLHRVEKIILDEGIGAIPSLSHTFLTKVGSAVEDHLE
jgi:TPP-dependent pyruvate/acetoin dehydrogenase alpha subunit